MGGGGGGGGALFPAVPESSENADERPVVLNRLPYGSDGGEEIEV